MAFANNLFATGLFLRFFQDVRENICEADGWDRMGWIQQFAQPGFQLVYPSAKLPDFPVGDFDFPVEIATLGADAALLHLECRHAQMHGGYAFTNHYRRDSNMSI